MRQIPEASSKLPGHSGHRFGQTEIAVEDWDMLFRAVTDRLTQCATSVATSACLPPAPQSASSIQAVVLECVEALEQLHAALGQQQSRCSQAANAKKIT